MGYITFEHVCKHYQTGDTVVKALDDVNFSIEKGEFCVVLGPSGAGKTTLLNLLGGMDKATSGTITVGGKQITGLRGPQLTDYRRTDVGFVFQFYNLMPNLTALENVELARQVCKNALDPKTVMEQVGLGSRMNNFPAQLSGGEQQRVAIARALVNNPSTIIADEPTGNLDPDRSMEIMSLLERINALGTTMLVVTHEKGLVNHFNKRVIHIEDGVVASDEEDGFYIYGDDNKETDAETAEAQEQ